MDPFVAADKALESLLGIMLKRVNELTPEQIKGFLFAIQLVQTFKAQLQKGE